MPRQESIFTRAAALPCHGARVRDALVVQRTLGVGGMGGVLLARDEALHRDVAVKMVLPELLEAHGTRESFLSEARAMAAVQHENVVQIYDFGDYHDIPYIVMEYVPGHTLEERILGSEEGVSADEALGVLELVCRGLGAIHDRGLIHGDVKPSNVLIGPAFRVYLSDFGIAQRAGEVAAAVGTAAYMAPERVDEDAYPPDHRADLYSLGCVAFELLTGRPPFDAPDLARVHAQHLYKDIPQLSERRPDLPATFQRMIERALQKDPNDRFACANEFRDAISDARRSLPRVTAQRVLVVDDDPAFVELVRACIQTEIPGVEVDIALAGAAALKAASHRRYDVVVSDLSLPDVNGIELTASLRHEDPALRILVVTGHGAARDWRVLSKIGADGFLLKPVEPAALVSSIERLLLRAPVRRVLVPV